MKLVCKCGYSWDYRGKLQTATCPSCQGKVKVPRPEKESDDGEESKS